MLRFSATAIVLALAVATGPSCAFADATLKCTPEVKASMVKLSDLFDNIPEGIDREVAAAAQPGGNFTYDSKFLEKLSQQYRLYWQPGSITDHCTITRASTHISAGEISDAVVKKIKSEFIELGDSQIDVFFDAHNMEIHLPVEQSADFDLNNFSYDSRNKRFKADLFAGKKEARIIQPITGHVAIKRNIPVLAQRLSAGSVIGYNDLGWITMSSDYITPDIITNTAGLIDKELRRDTAENQPLKARDIIEQRLVTRGNLVTMLVETPYMKITAQGRALQDGSMGDTVKLANTQSKKIVEGIVTGHGIVKIVVAGFVQPAQALAKQQHTQN